MLITEMFNKKGEWENSVYYFEIADIDMLLKMFEMCEKESLTIRQKRDSPAGI